MENELALWLSGDLVATVSRETSGKVRLRYSDAALSTFELGMPLLSIGLPLADVSYPNARTRAFLDGLLPEGEQRRVIAEQLDLSANDTFGLIRELGRDCAGAIVVQPRDEPAPAPATTLTARPLTDEEITDQVVNLKNAPLGLSDHVRISLAGVQEKLLLTRRIDGTWGSPTDGTPSTHLLKPEIRAFPNTVANEAFCMRFARYLGVRTATIDTTEFGGRPLIVVERFDRLVAADGSVQRIHQEDFCQVFSRSPKDKYQHDGGPSLRQIAGILRQYADPQSLIRLLEMVFVNVLVGNGDAHGKNFSVLHHRDGRIELAPLYDSHSTLYSVDSELSMYIDNVQKTRSVTYGRLMNEAITWGIRPDVAARTLSELSERVPRAVETAAAQTQDPPGAIPEIVASQFKNLQP